MATPAFDASLGMFYAAVALTAVLSAALWVYRDARAHSARGNPVVYSWSSIQIRTPAGWFIACALVFEMFIPIYLDNRRPA